MKTITKAELIAELKEFNPDAPVMINVGAKSYPIETVISGTANGIHAVILEAPIQIGRPPKYRTEDEKAAAQKEKWTRANLKRRKNK